MTEEYKTTAAFAKPSLFRDLLNPTDADIGVSTIFPDDRTLALSD